MVEKYDVIEGLEVTIVPICLHKITRGALVYIREKSRSHQVAFKKFSTLFGNLAIMARI
jgi:hypothetical protein